MSEPLGLDPASLVGRWCTDTAGDRQGQIVAEPAPGVYLVQPEDTGKGQRLEKLAAMIEQGWRFWDAPPAESP
jgi:hypothetical protein